MFTDSCTCINSFWIKEKEVSREMNKVKHQINDSQPKYMLYMYHFVSSFHRLKSRHDFHSEVNI